MTQGRNTTRIYPFSAPVRNLTTIAIAPRCSGAIVRIAWQGDAELLNIQLGHENVMAHAQVDPDTGWAAPPAGIQGNDFTPRVPINHLMGFSLTLVFRALNSSAPTLSAAISGHLELQETEA